MRNLLAMSVFVNIGRRKFTDRRINPYLSVFLFIVFLILLGVASGNAQTIIFTGDAETDFSGIENVVAINDSLDVGVPPGWPFPYSGWDIKTVYFFTNLNQLFIGIDYFGVAGDADGDGDPNSSSMALQQRGGQDLPDMANSEGFAVAIDLDQDNIFDVVAGVPAQDPDGGTLGCANFDFNDCFGLYNYLDEPGVEQATQRFLSLIDSTNTLFALPSSETPDIEFTIENWDTLTGWGNVEANSCETFSFGVGLFSGSFQDDGVGEDTMPNGSNSATVTFEVCADCEGTIFGTTELDECGVCDGDNSTCLDCAGIPNGDTEVDECGVCGGDNSTCTVQPIPTLSEWGLMAMAGILGIVGFMVIRRRRVTA